ncbi:MAG TPA: cytochrome c3 family protein [Gemmatimonadaceae bacterium]|nr:cytochrome c3 family protein [Gemmatimonadaceae bacterium]
MIALGRRAVGGLVTRLASAVAAGTLAGVLGSTITSCSTGTPAVASADTGQRVAVVEASAGEASGGAMRNDCLSCHTAAHQSVLGRGPAALVRCEECHAKVHAGYRNIEALYAGTTRDSAVHADVMYQAHVACVQCHAEGTLAKAPAARSADLDAACTSCHGPKFAGMVARWIAGADWRTHDVSGFVNRAAADARLGGSAARAKIQFARQAAAFVASGGAVHNIKGSDALLRDALDSVSVAYKLAGVEMPAAPALGPDPARVSCVGCHYGIESARDSAFGLRFDHGAHVLTANVACTKCHSGADYLVPSKRDSTKDLVDPRHGKTFVTASTCETCHHAATNAAACTACHSPVTRTIAVSMPLKLTQRGAPASRTVAFDHARHASVDCANCHTSRPAVRNVASCDNCHQNHHEQATQCSACHGTTTHDAHKAADHLNCTACHARQTVAMLTPNRAFCVTCHADHVNHKPGRECSSCHMQSTPAELKQRILSGSGTH